MIAGARKGRLQRHREASYVLTDGVCERVCSFLVAL